MTPLPVGEQLRKELLDRGISLTGIRLNANSEPMESAMQDLLRQALRDGREERAVLNAEAQTALSQRMVTATWAVAFASGVLILTSIVQIIAMLRR